MPNLLSRQPLTEVNALAETYVVWNNKDYRMTLETLVSLVSKQSLGLSKVENTSDSEKRISDATALALAGKADKNSVVSNEAFAAFQATLEQYVTLSQLNTAVADLTALINNQQELTPEQVTGIVNQILAPINQSLIQMRQDIESQAQAITALQQQAAGFATTSEVTSQLTQFEQSIGSQLTQVSNGIGQTLTTMSQQNIAEFQRVDDAAAARKIELDAQMYQFVQQFDSVNNLITQLNTDLTNHTHDASDIAGLQSTVETIVSEIAPGASAIAIGPLQW